MTLKTTTKLILSICLLLIKLTTAAVPTPKDVLTTVAQFTCAGKVIGGYYADVYENCQMFHVCTIGVNGETRDIVFRCLTGTVFDQETRVCERQAEVDCSLTESFYHLNNVLYGPGIIPDTAGTLKQDRRQTQTQKFRDNETPPTSTTTIDSESVCRGKTHAILFADPQTGCKRFHVCIPQLPHSELTRSFVCADKGFAFDQKTGKCTKREEIECSPQTSPFPLSIVDAETFAVYTLGLCSFMGRGTFVLDSLSGCEQYIQCPFDHPSAVTVKRCPDGYLFSQTYQKCLAADKVLCHRERFSLSKLVQLKTAGILQENVYWDVKHSKGVHSSVKINSISEMSPLVRRRRALTLGDENSRQSSSGVLNDQAGIVNGHVSVIEAQSPGNVVVTNEAVPRITLQPDARFTQSSGKHPVNNISVILKKNLANPPSVRPETSLGINKTTLNGTTIEVSEIAAPDQKGIVTITSVVPKTVRNGNGGSKTTRAPLNDIPSHRPTVITNGKTKITLLGSAPSTTFDETRSEEESGTTTVEDGESGTTLEDAKSMDTDESTVTVAPSPDKETVIEEIQAVTDAPSTNAQETTTLQLEETTQEVSETDDEISLQEVLMTEEPIAEVTTDMPTSTSSKEAQVTSTVSTTPVPPSTTTTAATTTTTTSATTTTTPTTTETTTEPSTETNFTCKDKVLDNFYPDIEKNCRLFHYCSPGFTNDEVLDLTFVCSGDTRFDINSKKCQDMTTVVCGDSDETKSSPLTSPSKTSAVSPTPITKAPAPTTASPTTIPETTYSPKPEESDDGATLSASASLPDVDTTTLETASSSTSESENWNEKVEAESTGTTMVEEELSTHHHSLKIGDNTETTTTFELTDSSHVQNTFSTIETTSCQPSPSSDLSAMESSNKDVDSSTSEGRSSSGGETTIPSEAETTATDDPLAKDLNTNSENNLEESSFSTSSPTASTTDTEIPDDNLNLITDGDAEESSLSTSFPSETSAYSESRHSTTEALLTSELDTDVPNSESVSSGDVPP